MNGLLTLPVSSSSRIMTNPSLCSLIISRKRDSGIVNCVLSPGILKYMIVELKSLSKIKRVKTFYDIMTYILPAGSVG